MLSDPSERPAILGGTPARALGPREWPLPDEEVRQALESLAKTSDWGHYEGPATAEFGKTLSEWFTAEHVFLCASGTSGIELALRGMNLQPGDEVLLAAYDFKGNFLNVLTVGAVPVLVDLDPVTGQLDIGQMEMAATARTRAVIASHLHGGLVDMTGLRQFAQRHGWLILEDACQMPGAINSGHRVGMMGDVGVISFGGSKLLSAGRGGAILTNHSQIAARIRRHKIRGSDVSPLSELQATVLLPQLRHLEARRTQRRACVQRLAGEFADQPGFQPIVSEQDGQEADYYKLAWRYSSDHFQGLSRDVFALALRAEGIPIAPGFRALHKIHARSRFRQVGDLPQANLADANWLVLHHPMLLDEAAAVREILTAVEKVRRFAERIRDTISAAPSGLWDDA